MRCVRGVGGGLEPKLIAPLLARLARRRGLDGLLARGGGLFGSGGPLATRVTAVENRPGKDGLASLGGAWAPCPCASGPKAPPGPSIPARLPVAFAAPRAASSCRQLRRRPQRPTDPTEPSESYPASAFGFSGQWGACILHRMSCRFSSGHRSEPDRSKKGCLEATTVGQGSSVDRAPIPASFSVFGSADPTLLGPGPILGRMVRVPSSLLVLSLPYIVGQVLGPSPLIGGPP